MHEFFFLKLSEEPGSKFAGFLFPLNGSFSVQLLKKFDLVLKTGE